MKIDINLVKNNITYYFTNIIFILTFIYKDEIAPLNILVLFGSIKLSHIYPNYYKLLKNTEDYKYYLIYDIILHYCPFFYLSTYKKITPNYILSFNILLLYLILFNHKIKKKYFL